MTSEQRLRRSRRALEGLLGVPATEGNVLDVLRNGVEIFPAMLGAIESARHTIDLLTYVYWTGAIADRFGQALAAAASRGVRVRVILDGFGAASMDRELLAHMESSGCLVTWFRPPTTWKLWEVDRRTHRKVLVCDEEVAFTGGVGIAEEWEGDARNADEWRDTHVRVRGPAVDGLRAAFVSNWMESGHPLFDERDRFPDQPQEEGGALIQVLRSPAQIGWNDLALAYEALIRLARERLRITSAYFVPDERFRNLLCAAARRGVEVEILVPGAHADHKVVRVAGQADYEPMLEAGVRIWQYERSMLHAKVMTVDGCVTCVGSGNFDQRSMRLNDEANIVVFDPELVATLDRHFDEDLVLSREVHPHEWNERTVPQRIAEAATEIIDRKL